MFTSELSISSWVSTNVPAKIEAEDLRFIPKTSEHARHLENLERGIIPARAGGQIKLALGKTRFTPINVNGKKDDAGLEHINSRHFHNNNNQSQFTISIEALKTFLQSLLVTKAEIIVQGVGLGTKYKREVDCGFEIGRVRINDGGYATTYIRVITDRAGNLITAFPIPISYVQPCNQIIPASSEINCFTALAPSVI
jgi:hypothetical protein